MSIAQMVYLIALLLFGGACLHASTMYEKLIAWGLIVLALGIIVAGYSSFSCLS